MAKYRVYKSPFLQFMICFGDGSTLYRYAKFCLSTPLYSFFSASAGFVLAARSVCHNTERKASSAVSRTATTKTQP